MKNFIYFVSVFALLGLTGCGGESGDVATTDANTDTQTTETQVGIDETPTTQTLPAIPQIPVD